MMKKLIAAGLGVAGVAAGSFAAATPAHAAYYQEQFSSWSKASCDEIGNQLAQSKKDQGYLVTWTGCGRASFNWVGYVAWSD